MTPETFYYMAETLQKSAAIPVNPVPAEHQIAPMSPNVGQQQGQPQKKKFLTPGRMVGGALAAGLGAYALKNPGLMKAYGKQVAGMARHPIQSMKAGLQSGMVSKSPNKMHSTLTSALEHAQKGKKVSYRALDDALGIGTANVGRRTGILSTGRQTHGTIEMGTKQSKRIEGLLSDAKKLRAEGKSVEHLMPQLQAEYKALRAAKVTGGPTGMQRAVDTAHRLAPGEASVFMGLPAYSAIKGGIKEKADPETGRRYGVGERVGRAAAGTAGAVLTSPLFGAGHVVAPMLGSMAVDKTLRTGIEGAGRLTDKTRARHRRQ